MYIGFGSMLLEPYYIVNTIFEFQGPELCIAGEEFLDDIDELLVDSQDDMKTSMLFSLKFFHVDNKEYQRIPSCNK